MQSRFKKNNKESVEKSVVFKNILNYFGLCKPQAENEGVYRTSTIPNDPASQMEMRLSKKQNRGSATSSKEDSRYALGNKPYNNNQVFVLGYQHKIIAKITSKTIKDYHSKMYQSQNSSPMTKIREAPNISPLLRPRVSSDLEVKEEFSLDLRKEVCPEQENQKLSNSSVARYLAHRLKCDVLIDAIGGIGYNLRQFSKYCNHVVAFEANEKKTQIVQKQLENYPETQNIDFIMSDFRKIGKLLWSDIIFIDCQDIALESLDSELSSLLAKSLQVSHSVALKLPADIDIDELPRLFNTIVDDNDIFAKRFCIEVEKVMNEEGQVECTVVYFGNCAQIEIQEECEAIYDYLLAFEEDRDEEGIENPKKVLRHPFAMAKPLFEKVGIQKVLKLVCEVEDDLAFTNMSFSLYELFLEKIIYQRIYTKENLEKTIEEESYKASKSTLSILNSGNTHYYTTDTKLTTTENKVQVQKPEENKENFATGTISNTLALDGNTLEKNGTFDSLPKFKVQHKNTEDYSELSISSYAVSSDYFDEDPDDSLMDSRVSGRSSQIHDILKLQSRELIDNPLEAIENKQRAVSSHFGGLRTSSSPKKNLARGQTPLDLLNSQKFSSTKDNSEFTISGMDQ